MPRKPFKHFPAENKSQVLSLKKPSCHGYWLDHKYRTPICGSFSLWLSGALSIKQHASSLEGQPTCSQKLKDWVVTKYLQCLKTWVVPNCQFHWLSQVSVFFCLAGTATSLGEAKGTTDYQGAAVPGSTAGTADHGDLIRISIGIQMESESMMIAELV